MADDDLDDVAAELYALTPAEFTAARNARADRASGDAARAIRALRKPVVAAYAVDLLAQAGALGEALELAAALREAQDDLDAAEMTRLGRQRRALVAALSRQAADLARDRGVAVSAAALGDVESTIDAAVRDDATAAAVLTGRLVRPLAATGVDPVDLTDAVGGSIPGIADRPARPPAPRDDLAERRARRAAEKALREAERAAADADRRLGRVEAAVAKARERAGHLAERTDELRAELERLQADAARAEAAVAAAEDERTAAAEGARAARRVADEARRAVDAATRPSGKGTGE
ncbi:transposase [Microbacterium wangruii]|uniref:transposase n=1 Tax=Microbacterium wangruii TaxID=3049073 RepID=UPI00256F38DE|nr:transposase [Microbacterium sp. zg-Y1211]MDL5487528.1 transposase [Microbacterium sp. zg-Y1211]